VIPTAETGKPPWCLPVGVAATAPSARAGVRVRGSWAQRLSGDPVYICDV
jgi:hypothetical protein